MKCVHESKLWDNLWCSVACMYCTLSQEETCRHKKSIPDTNVVKTNAQHIRSVSDEELAKFLLEIMSNSVCFGEGAFPYHPCPQDQDCVKCGLNWLKQPHKEN